MFRFLTICFILLCIPSVFGQKKKTVVRAKEKQVSQCQLTEAPTLRGFFLGQTVDEIDKFIPGFKTAYNLQKKGGSGIVSQTDYRGSWENRLGWKDIGAVKLFGYFDENAKINISGDDFFNESETPLSFPNDGDELHKLEWWFFEDKLYGFAIYYGDYIPDSARSFAKQLSQKTDLPQTGWVATDKANAKVSAVLKCNGFKVDVHTAYKVEKDYAFVTITNTNVEARVLLFEKEIRMQRKKEEQKRIRLQEEKQNTLKP